MSLDRRSFLLAALGSASGFARGQPAPRRVVCFACGGTRIVPALADRGWKDGHNLRFESRLLDPHLPQPGIDAAARELVATHPDAIVTLMREHVGALVRATRSIPVVAALHDPVVEGFARSLARPGGNVTGVSFSSPESVQMVFRLLGAVLPELKRIHTLEPRGWHELPTVRATRGGITAERGYAFEPHAVESYADAVSALGQIRNRREEAIVLAVAVPGFDYADFAARVLRARVAALDMTGEMQAASLLGAGLRHKDFMGRMAAIVDQVLRGANPATIPFEQPTHAEVVLNRRTAAAIGVTFPPDVLLRATKIID